MKAFSHLLLTILLLLVGGFFSSCSQNRPTRIDDQGRVIVTMNNGPIQGDQARVREDEITRTLFEEMNPGLTWFASPWQFSPETFLARVAGNTCTDVIGIADATAGLGLSEAGLAMELTDLLQNWEYFDQLNPVVLGSYQRSDGIFGLPANPGYSMCLAYNRQMFIDAGIVDENGEPTPPNNWDELVDYAVRLTDRENEIYGFAILAKDDAASWQFLNWAYQSGGEFERQAEDGRWHAVYDEPETVRALEFIKSLRWEYDVLPHNALMTNDDQMQLFAANRLAMCVFVPEYLDYMARVYSYPVENVGISMLPAGPAGYACIMGGSFNIINPRLTDERQIEGAFRAITFMLMPERWELRCRIMREQGRPVGYPAVSFWRDGSEMAERWQEAEDRHRNVPANPEYVALASANARYEPPIHCKQLYTELFPIIQDVLTNPNYDCAAALAASAARFEARHLP